MEEDLFDYPWWKVEMIAALEVVRDYLLRVRPLAAECLTSAPRSLIAIGDAGRFKNVPLGT